MFSKSWHDIKFYTVREVGEMLAAAGIEKSMKDELLSFSTPRRLRCASHLPEEER